MNPKHFDRENCKTEADSTGAKHPHRPINVLDGFSSVEAAMKSELMTDSN